MRPVTNLFQLQAEKQITVNAFADWHLLNDAYAKREHPAPREGVEI